MDWLQVLVIVFGNLAWIMPLFLWSRSESRADMRHVDAQLNAQRGMIDEMRRESREFNERWFQETRDFHGRLERIDAEFKAHLMHSSSSN